MVSFFTLYCITCYLSIHVCISCIILLYLLYYKLLGCIKSCIEDPNYGFLQDDKLFIVGSWN